MRFRTFLTAIVVAALTWQVTTLAAESAAPARKIFLGYLYGAPQDINYGLYTHLCHAFVVAGKDGKLLPSEGVPSRKLTEQAHQHGVKVLLSLGGWGWDENFATITLDSAAEDHYVKAVLELVAKYDYDGIDLDWEYPDTPIEIVGFERLARRFRAGLDELGKQENRHLSVTMAAAADPKSLAWLRRDFLLETMDWVDVMTYDYTGSWSTFAGHHAPLFASSKLSKDDAFSTELTMKYLVDQRHIPADRLAVGIPLYGKAFAVAKPYMSTKGAPKPKVEARNFRDLRVLELERGWKRQWDDETKTPWLISPEGSEIIGYDDAESVALKTKWAMQQGFRGVFFWQIDSDRMPDGSRPLQDAAKAAWSAGTQTR